MSNEAERIWWINAASGVEGPFTRDEVFEATRTGRIQAETLICRGQNGQWLAAGVSFPSAFGSISETLIVQTPRSDLNRQESVGLSVFLTLITLGIWFVVWLYPRLTWYAQQSGRPMGSRVTYYWLVIGFNVAAIVLGFLTFFFWFPLFIAAVVFGALLTYDLAKHHHTIVTTRHALIGLAATPTTLVVLYAVGNGIGVTIFLLPVTLILVIIFYWLFFKNHNAAVAAATQRS